MTAPSPPERSNTTAAEFTSQLLISRASRHAHHRRSGSAANQRSSALRSFSSARFLDAGDIAAGDAQPPGPPRAGAAARRPPGRSAARTTCALALGSRSPPSSRIARARRDSIGRLDLDRRPGWDPCRAARPSVQLAGRPCPRPTAVAARAPRRGSCGWRAACISISFSMQREA